MAKKTDNLEWFGADRESLDGGRTVNAAFDGARVRVRLIDYRHDVIAIMRPAWPV